MKNRIAVFKEKDWSLNLEDPYYENHLDDLFDESVEAVKQTGKGCYVNIVTPGKHGDPRDWFISRLNGLLEKEAVPFKEIRYIDECGCGGYVTRVFC